MSKVPYLLVALLLSLVAGCGGGGGGGNNTPTTGKAVFSMQWATRSRVVPAVAESVLIEILDDATKIAEKLVLRPSGGDISRVTFENIPIGNHSARATAFPQTDGSGTAVGKAVVSCPVNNISDPVAITLDPQSTIDHLEAGTSPVTLHKGKTYTVNVVAKNANGAVVLIWTPKLQFSSSNATVASITNAGVVTGATLGQARITATEGDSNKSVNLDVNVINAPLDHLEITPSSTALNIGDTYSIIVVGKDTDGGNFALDPAKLQFSSANTSLATVNSTGVVTGKAAGKVRITVTETSANKTATLDVTVHAKPLQNISFETPRSFSVPTATDYISAGDLDGDGKADVVVGGDSGLFLLYGKGNGDLEPYTTVVSGLSRNFALGDMNGDGKLDIICSNGNDFLRIIPNQGGRAWGTPIDIPIGTYIHHAAVGDFNGDGRLDIALVNNRNGNAGKVIIVQNNGGGSFSVVNRYTLDTPLAITVGDINGDGKPDIAVGYYSSPESGCQIYLGTGNCNFNGVGHLAEGNVGFKPVIFDFNGDGKADIAFTVVFSNEIATYLGVGNGSFTSKQTYATFGYPSMMWAADIDLDGFPDLVTAHNGSTSFSFLRNNNGTGLFAIPITYSSGGDDTRSIAIADFNNDGKIDIVAQNQGSQRVSVILNTSH